VEGTLGRQQAGQHTKGRRGECELKSLPGLLRYERHPGSRPHVCTPEGLMSLIHTHTHNTHRYIDREIDRETDRDRQTQRHRETQRDRETERHRETDRQTDRDIKVDEEGRAESDRQTDRKEGRQIGRKEEEG